MVFSYFLIIKLQLFVFVRLLQIMAWSVAYFMFEFFASAELFQLWNSKIKLTSTVSAMD